MPERGELGAAARRERQHRHADEGERSRDEPPSGRPRCPRPGAPARRRRRGRTRSRRRCRRSRRCGRLRRRTRAGRRRRRRRRRAGAARPERGGRRGAGPRGRRGRARSRPRRSELAPTLGRRVGAGEGLGRAGRADEDGLRAAAGGEAVASVVVAQSRQSSLVAKRALDRRRVSLALVPGQAAELVEVEVAAAEDGDDLRSRRRLDQAVAAAPPPARRRRPRRRPSHAPCVQSSASKIFSSGSVTMSSTQRLTIVEGRLADPLHLAARRSMQSTRSSVDHAGRAATLPLHRRRARRLDADDRGRRA